MDGTKLADQAFTLKAGMPPLAFNSLQTQSERGAHSGYAHVVRSVLGAVPQPNRARAQGRVSLTEEDALNMLATVSRSIAGSTRPTVTPAPPGYGAARLTAS